MTYEETLEYLFRQLPMYQRQGKSAYKKDLTNTLALCEVLKNPHDKFKSIHIAGTNGKGSSAHMLASIFQEAGYKTGLYTSPHLKDFRERIRINGEVISKTSVVDFVKKYDEKFKSISPSFFEWTVALAFDSFAEEKVDIAIIETGLGGRLDSTNIINPEICLITNIGFDHMDMLGDTLTAIAGEKAGIIKKSVPVVVSNHSGEREVFKRKAEEMQAPVVFANEIEYIPKLASDLDGNYQRENIKGVYLTCQLAIQQGWKVSDEQLKKGLLNVKKNTNLRGRWDVLKERPLIIADTAHNKEGLSIALEQLLQLSHETLRFVIGFVKDKDIETVLQLFPKNATYYFCQANVPRALAVEDLKQIAERIGYKGSYYKTVNAAFNEAKKNQQNADIIYVGGSNFVVAEIL